MIFVAVGTQKFQFNRLLRALDTFKKSQESEEIFAQIGHSNYQPKNYEYKDFLSKNEYEECIKKCDLLITHSGVATIMVGLKYNKPIIVVPRLSKYSEHVDDHQLEIAKEFESQKYILLCEEMDDLEKVISKSKLMKFQRYISATDEMVAVIKDFMEKSI